VPWPRCDDSSVGLFAWWWYICIGLAFVALAVRAFVAGAPGWSVGLRVLVAIGFVLLGVVELRPARKIRAPVIGPTF